MSTSSIIADGTRGEIRNEPDRACGIPAQPIGRSPDVAPTGLLDASSTQRRIQ